MVERGLTHGDLFTMGSGVMREADWTGIPDSDMLPEEVKVMSERRPKGRRKSVTLGARQLQPAEDGVHPAEVSGLFRNDPTFDEFRKILTEQREQENRQANEVNASAQDEANGCSSSIPIRSRMTKTRTRSSSKK
jgi:hypothetical protein